MLAARPDSCRLLTLCVHHGSMTTDYRSLPVLKETLAYWEAKRGSRRMPRRRDLDPLHDIPRLLPNVQLADVIDGGRRFRMRVVGSRIVEALGRDGTGKFLDETLTGDRLARVQRDFR